MIKVGFIGSVSKEWMGGLNYFKNLLFAINSVEKKELEVFVFVGKKIDIETKRMFQEYATVIEDSVFDRKSIKWFLSKIEQKIFKTNILLENILKKHNIQILSHAATTNLKNVKTINWIPDFQHIHLPQMFSEKEIQNRNNNFLKLIRDSDLIVLSSFDALKDMKKFAPNYKDKARVLQFVSQPNSRYFELDEHDKSLLLQRYEIKDDFFYIPNQFWKHKNHMMIFEAISELKKDGIEINIVCTGYLGDYRDKTYIDDAREFIKSNNLEDNIKLLGLVDYEDVFVLIKFSKAVINPSLFEGWSSTVEECKSVGKNMILSNLDVHKEQYPNAVFFKRDSIESLKEVLKFYKIENKSSVEPLEARTKKFANIYSSICREALTY
ncbi:glycosyltransferase family 4 protein [Campylobacter concisus]|uniref:glycosyltransferase family 4 protein n=1 Tax=Campylobacter concisus TaxID=199 RepID=UPI0018AB1937|nr:glycosyltransferase family 1 protein [Campylobacter concisus]QPH98700.1 glycosyltransferase family 4 protein [Campylobacter concisus]QPI00493.1 glycosyltransferase family 4 protein [Campylobacter concisus]